MRKRSAGWARRFAQRWRLHYTSPGYRAGERRAVQEAEQRLAAKRGAER